MRRSAVARHSLPPAAAAALGFGVATPRALQALTLAAPATTPPPLGSCLPPCHRRRSSLCSSAASAASSASAATTALAVEEARRGRKQLGMDPPLYEYLLANVREHPLLRDLREETAAMRGSQMQVHSIHELKTEVTPSRLKSLKIASAFIHGGSNPGTTCIASTTQVPTVLLQMSANSKCKMVSPAQAQLLAMLVQILGAQRCIEVGVFTGYSSLAVALALPESGRLVACERDERCLEVARRYYRLAGVAHKVDVKHALAVDSLRSLLESGEASSYDFSFVDADKRMYKEYFELLLKLVRVGGLIVMDNVLWYGKVADPLVNDPKTISIRDFNKKLLEDKRVNISMVPIGDGMTICRKLEDD